METVSPERLQELFNALIGRGAGQAARDLFADATEAEVIAWIQARPEYNGAEVPAMPVAEEEPAPESIPEPTTSLNVPLPTEGMSLQEAKDGYNEALQAQWEWNAGVLPSLNEAVAGIPFGTPEYYEAFQNWNNGVVEGADGQIDKDAWRDAIVSAALAEGVELQKDDKLYSFGDTNVNELIWRETLGRDNYISQGDPQEGYYSIQEYGGGFGPTEMASIVFGALVAPALATTLTSAAGGIAGSGSLASALGSAGSSMVLNGVSQAIAGGLDFDQLLQAGLTAGISSAGFNNFLSENLDKLMPEAVEGLFSSENFVGDLFSNTAQDMVLQGITTGELDIQDALEAGLISVGQQMAWDTFYDTVQTANITDQTIINGTNAAGAADPAERARLVAQLETTTDLRGLLGENGFLSQIGIPTNFLNTELLNNGIEGVANALLAIPGAEELIDFLSGFAPEGDGTQRYDERFFDIATERSSGAALEGIWTENPYLRNASANVASIISSAYGSQPSGSGEATTLPIGSAGSDFFSFFNSPTVVEEEQDLLADTTEDPLLNAGDDDFTEDPVLNVGDDDFTENPVLNVGDDDFTEDPVLNVGDDDFTENPVLNVGDDDFTSSSGGDGGGGGGGDGMMSGNYTPKWGELFAYTTLTPYQKKAIEPIRNYVAQAKGMLS